MEMQDKEFDKLFREKLERFETAPSANVWTGVTSGLDGAKHRGNVRQVLSIAASIIMLIAAGVLFYPQKQHQAATHPVKGTYTETAKLAAGQVIAQTAIKPQVIQPARIDKQNEIAAHRSLAPRLPKAMPTGTGTAVTNHVNNAPQTELAALPEKKPEMLSAVAPDDRIQIAAKQLPDDQPDFVTKPVLVAVQLPVATANTMPVKTTHKIRSFGDLMNAVVGKIDKRKDKIIEFSSDDDDDGSTITGVNLGIIKIKKEK